MVGVRRQLQSGEIRSLRIFQGIALQRFAARLSCGAGTAIPSTTDDLLNYLPRTGDRARGLAGKLAPWPARGHAPVAASLNPAASNHLRLLCAGNGLKGEKRLGHCPNRSPGCVLEVVLLT